MWVAVKSIIKSDSSLGAIWCERLSWTEAKLGGLRISDKHWPAEADHLIPTLDS